MARSLEFSDQVANLADRVIHGMTLGGKNEYNAVHLRIEKDARDWSQIMGGEQVLPHHILLIVINSNNNNNSDNNSNNDNNIVRRSS